MTAEEEKEKDVLFACAFKFPEHTNNLVKFVGAAKEKFAKVESWAALGLCWGGKVRVLHLSGVGWKLTALANLTCFGSWIGVQGHWTGSSCVSLPLSSYHSIVGCQDW